MVKIDGSCHCGKISYEAEVDPKRSAFVIAPIASN
jgi:hypothetical protein